MACGRRPCARGARLDPDLDGDGAWNAGNEELDEDVRDGFLKSAFAPPADVSRRSVIGRMAGGSSWWPVHHHRHYHHHHLKKRPAERVGSPAVDGRWLHIRS